MRATLKILLCDDFEDRGNDAVRAIRRLADSHPGALALEIDGLYADELKRELESLFDNARRILDHDYTLGLPNLQDPRQTRLGSADYDIVILDNNLKALPFRGTRPTADDIAGYVRAFTPIPYVVSLNKHPEVDFDLSYLVGDRQTPADVAVNQDHLENLALWTGNPNDSNDGFRPWYWPALHAVPRIRREQISFVESRVDVSLLDALSFPRDSSDYLSPRARAQLRPLTDRSDPNSIEHVTFGDFFVDSSMCPPVREERRAVLEASPRNPELRTIVARVVAADVHKWLRSEILGPQDVLVDLPHLLMRMPFLLGDRAADLLAWNAPLSAAEAPYGLNPDIFAAHLNDAMFDFPLWMHTPCFWWPKLKSSEPLNALFYGTADGDWADAVFCEDVSAFRLASDPHREEPEEFATELEGSWGRRYVARVANKNYAPGTCFAA